MSRFASSPEPGAPAPSEPSYTNDLFASRYRLEGLLGRGGMGTVSRAFDVERQRVVALKRLDLSARKGAGVSESATTHGRASAHRRIRSQMIGLFQREYQLLVELAHPRVIDVYDYGVQGDEPYYTMELLEGRDLARTQALPWRDACAILRDVAAALTLLHARRLLHRDISPGNVHVDRDGSAKLIDFGATSPMGIPHFVVGTPAFVAPEVLDQQPLDARADLYSLGALAYLLLTGRTAYSARSLAELRDALRSRPQPPSTYAADVPTAIDALVMSLLSVDRAARPRSAVEVMEQLSATAGLAHDKRLAVASAYLTTPSLVGRSVELLRVRRRALRALRGRGAALLFQGVSGVGRSRFLDACTVEGKLAGALVLRVDGDAGSEPYGGLRSVLRQLHIGLSSAERASLALPELLRRELLGRVDWQQPACDAASFGQSALKLADRAALHDEGVALLQELTKRRPVLLAVDGIERLDEPSAAVIATLSQSVRSHKLLIVATYDQTKSASSPDSLKMLSEYGRTMTLAPLTGAQTEQLLASVFGDVANVSVIASRIHTLAGGLPAATMEFAQHLLDRGVIRYESGGFELPDTLAHDDLPQSLSDALRARVERLPPDAQVLGTVLALSDGVQLSVADAIALSELSEASSGQRAVTDLLSAQLVSVQGERIAVRQKAMSEALLVTSCSARQKRLRHKLADYLAQNPELVLRAAELYLHAECPERAIDVLVNAIQSRQLSSFDWFTGLRQLLENAGSACLVLNRPARDGYVIQRALVQYLCHSLEPCERSQLLTTVDTLSRLSGLSDYATLPDTMPQKTRLFTALGAAAQRFAAASERDRILQPDQAVAQLARCVGEIIGYAAAAIDVELLQLLPSLTPFAPLSPHIEVAERVRLSMLDMRAGRSEQYVARTMELLELLRARQSKDNGKDDGSATRCALFTGLSMTLATFGDPRALEQAAEMDAVPMHRINAWRVRQVVALFDCDSEHAKECRRHIDLLKVQYGPRQYMQGSTVECEVFAYAAADDLLGLRRVLPELEFMAERHAGWRPILLITRGNLERVRGRPDLAEPLFREAMRLAPAGFHMMWSFACAGLIEVLIQEQRLAEARSEGAVMLQTADHHQLGSMSTQLRGFIALADGLGGALREGCARLDAMLRAGAETNRKGLVMGKLLEMRTRLSILEGDREGFARFLSAARAQLGYGKHGPLTAKLDRLAELARRAGVADEPQHPLYEEITRERVEAELREASDLSNCARGVIQLILKATRGLGGHLYAVDGKQLRLLASAPEGTPEPELGPFLEAHLAHTEMLGERTVELQQDQPANEQQLTGHLRLPGRVYAPVALAVERDMEMRIVALAAVASPAGHGMWPDAYALQQMAEELLARWH